MDDLPERKCMLRDVDFAFSGLPVLYEASLKPMSSKLLFRLKAMRKSSVAQSWRQMCLTVPMGTGPNSPQEEQVDVFAEHPVVRSVATDGLAWRAVE